jgi:hypothetical protein
MAEKKKNQKTETQRIFTADAEWAQKVADARNKDKNNFAKHSLATVIHEAVEKYRKEAL